MNDLVKRLRDLNDHMKTFILDEAADRIEKLVEENGVLFAANVRLNSRADLDSDGYVDRIEKLESALRWIVEQKKQTAHPTVCAIVKIARKALEGKND